jgi:DNA-binding winged helix-turn-helix (wHTH) protein/tetratricopeptide (TPR) repeat protein
MSISGKIELAHEPDFAIGALTVSPARREILREGEAREVLEHRVMQVLIALHRAQGGIVTRDELTLACWEGRIVGEDAINRVISRLRKVAMGVGSGVFHIDTLKKIGYRMVVDGTEVPPVQSAQEIAPPYPPERGTAMNRRRTFFLAGMVAAGTLTVAGSGGWLYRRIAKPDVPPEVRTLMVQGRQLLGHRNNYSYFQAIGMYRRVVELAPEYADGWGMLGFAYAVPSHFQPRAESLSLRKRAESAARRALELDRGNAYAEVALATALPWIGAWREKDRHIARAVKDRPNDDVVLVIQASALEFTGRYAEAIPLYDRIKRPLTPNTWNNYIRALWTVGRVEEMDRAADDAASLYPTYEPIWLTRFHLRAYGGDANGAIMLAQEEEGRPTTLTELQLADLFLLAHALRGRDPALIDDVMATQMARESQDASTANLAISNACALGRLDDAFALADAYYFGRGFIIPDHPAPASGFSPDQRQTRFLFEPVTRSMRADPRFNPLVEEIGLESYWRESGVQPDYRH